MARRSACGGTTWISRPDASRATLPPTPEPEGLGLRRTQDGAQLPDDPPRPRSDLSSARSQEGRTSARAVESWTGLAGAPTRVYNRDRAPTRVGYVNERFHRALADAGLPDLRIHDLRHTAATLLLTEACTRRSSRRCLGTARSRSLSILTAMLHRQCMPRPRGKWMACFAPQPGELPPRVARTYLPCMLCLKTIRTPRTGLLCDQEI